MRISIKAGVKREFLQRLPVQCTEEDRYAGLRAPGDNDTARDARRGEAAGVAHLAIGLGQFANELRTARTELGGSREVEEENLRAVGGDEEQVGESAGDLAECGAYLDDVLSRAVGDHSGG